MPRARFAMVLISVAFLLATFSSAQQTTSSSIPAIAASEQPPLPRLIRFSGSVTAATDARTVGITFSLYKDATGGAPLWQEIQNVTLRPGGHFSVLLGANSKDGVPTELFTTNEARWLGVQIEQEAEQPRVFLVSVPYALKAGDAETVAGHPVSDFVMTAAADGSSGSSGSASTSSGATATKNSASAPGGTFAYLGTQNYLAKFDASGTNMTNSSIIDNGNVGVNKSNPAYTLDVGGIVNAPYMFVQGASPRIRLIDTALTNSFWELQQSAYASDNFGFLRYENNTAVPGKSFLVAANGNVGIGTINPGFKLDVAGMVNTSALLVNSDSPRIRLTDTTLPNSFWELQQSAFFPDNFGFLRYESNGAVAGKSFFIAPTGNVGVGVASPANKLSVAGVIESSGGFKFPDGSVQLTAATGSSGGGVSSVLGTNGVTASTTSTTVTLSADTGYVQRRVSSTCTAGNAIRAIAADGSVTCEPIPAPTPGVPTGYAIMGGDPVPPAGYTGVGWTLMNAASVWTNLASMATPRTGAGAATACVGATSCTTPRIYVIGGYFNNTFLNTVEEYNPATNAWRVVASMSTARYYPAVTVYNNQIYVFGGKQSVSGGVLSGAEVFTPPTNDTTLGSWAALPDMPFPTYSAVGLTLSNQIYLLGGIQSGSAPTNVYKYDPVGHVYVPKTPTLIHVNSCATGAVRDNKIGSAQESEKLVDLLDSRVAVWRYARRDERQ